MGFTKWRTGLHSFNKCFLSINHICCSGDYEPANNRLTPWPSGSVNSTTQSRGVTASIQGYWGVLGENGKQRGPRDQSCVSETLLLLAWRVNQGLEIAEVERPSVTEGRDYRGQIGRDKTKGKIWKLIQRQISEIYLEELDTIL